MARARRGVGKKPKEKKEKAKKEKQPRRAKPARPEPDAIAVEEEDQLPLGLILMTSVFLVVAIVFAWMQLGEYGAGPFAG